MQSGLTDRQKLVLDFITRFIAEKGYGPTMREIGNGLGIGSTNGVAGHLKALEKKGYLEIPEAGGRGLARSMKVLKQSPASGGFASAVRRGKQADEQGGI